jgi:hypothetical protein
VDARQDWSVEVVDCKDGDKQCIHDSGPIELDVHAEGYTDRYGRPHCTPDHERFGFCEQE